MHEADDTWDMSDINYIQQQVALMLSALGMAHHQLCLFGFQLLPRLSPKLH